MYLKDNNNFIGNSNAVVANPRPKYGNTMNVIP